MNIGGQELILIFVILLIALGPKRLPEVARFISKAMRLFRKTVDEIKGDIGEGDDFRG